MYKRVFFIIVVAVTSLFNVSYAMQVGGLANPNEQEQEMNQILRQDPINIERLVALVKAMSVDGIISAERAKAKEIIAIMSPAQKMAVMKDVRAMIVNGTREVEPIAQAIIVDRSIVDGSFDIEHKKEHIEQWMGLIITMLDANMSLGADKLLFEGRAFEWSRQIRIDSRLHHDFIVAMAGTKRWMRPSSSGASCSSATSTNPSFVSSSAPSFSSASLSSSSL